MKKRCIPIILLIYLLCGFTTSNAQSNTAKDSITKVLKSYYLQERENIYVHFDKQLFFSNENIWFKGYVFDRKNSQPYFVTTNVYAILMNDKGENISEQLLFANSGTFSGHFALNENFQSGVYFIQFYTNWMNNFSEDESAVFQMTILNSQEQKIPNTNAIDYDSINISFQPEGGTLVEGVLNNIGIQINDCNEIPVGGINVEILNAASEVIKTVPINKAGFGKFSITPTSETYKSRFTINNQQIETLLPQAIKSGIALEINNFTISGKVIAKISTNQATLNNLKNKQLTLLVHQDENASLFDINFDDGTLKKEFTFSADNLYTGFNTIRIIDADFNQLATRLLFKYPDYKASTILQIQKKSADSITFTGKLNYGNANISISVLPEKSLVSKEKSDIFSAFLVNPYLLKQTSTISYYLTELSRSKQFEMDLVMLNQKEEQTDWQSIRSKPPKKTHDFDFGLTIKGGINQSLTDRSKYQVKIFSLKSFINESAILNEKNEFFFSNLILADSSWVNFTLYKDSKSEEIKPYTQILNRRRPFNKMFLTQIGRCRQEFEPMILNEMPQFSKDIIALDDILIKGKGKPKLTYQTKFGNANLRGHKIDTNTSAIDLMSFIRTNGFNVSNNLGEIAITGRLKTTLNAAPTSPEVYLDDRLLINLDELADMQMMEIDEIYINAHAIVASIKNNMGVIKIYRKKAGGNGYNNNAKSLLIENGFAKITPFENALYNSTSDKGFENYGLIHWIPTIMTDANGAFGFQIPKTELRSVMLRIEGFTADGKLISETQMISLQ